MIIHVDTMRDPSGAPNTWLAIQTQLIGFDMRERQFLIEDQPERMLAAIVNVGHAARAIERNGSLHYNKILIQDDRDNVLADHEQYEIFEMLTERKKKLLSVLGGNYEKYFKGVINLVRYWQITIGLASDVACPNCRLTLEAFQNKCGACGQRHQIKWR